MTVGKEIFIKLQAKFNNSENLPSMKLMLIKKTCNTNCSSTSLLHQFSDEIFGWVIKTEAKRQAS